MTLWRPPLMTPQRLARLLGIEVAVARDDLLPFPLASSKVRAVAAHLSSLDDPVDAVITNGGIDSNHCRTLAMFGAERGFEVHLVLHGDPSSLQSRASLALYTQLGATHTVVAPERIASTLARRQAALAETGARTHVIPGGCHTQAAAIAHRREAEQVFRGWRPDTVIVAAGTGAIQGGLAAAARMMEWPVRVIGISVARGAERGAPPVQTAAAWAGADDAIIDFRDEFRDGGYGQHGDATAKAVATGWSHGIPLDATYTGKAFRALVELSATDELKGKRTLFWHTGGLWNHLAATLATSRD